MSKTKEITVGVKLSYAYNTFECTETIVLDATDDVQVEKAAAFARCRQKCIEQCELGGFKK